MEPVVDHYKIESYSIALSEKLASEFFYQHKAINGVQLKNFSAITQLNLFILKNLFDKWKEETDKLKSPYFDYDNDEVKAALQTLLNKLSNHISISKEFFRPLLKKAVEDTLLLAIAPKAFFMKEYQHKGADLDNVNDVEKFFRINAHYLHAIKESLKVASDGKRSSGELELVLNGVRPADSSDILAIFSSLLKIEVNDVLIQPLIRQEPPQPVSSADNRGVEVPAQTPDQPTMPSKETKLTDLPSEAGKVVEKPLEPSDIDKSGNVSQPDERKPLVDKLAQITVSQDVPSKSSINDRFSNEQVTLNEMLKKKHVMPEEEPAKAVKTKIADLRSAISLNEKFAFIKNLFGDNSTDYAVALSAIERAPDLNAALHVLQQDFAVKYNWDQQSKDVKEFIELVERRFL